MVPSMKLGNWLSLRARVRRCLGTLLRAGFTEVRSDGAGWFAGSGYLVLRGPNMWVRIANHVGEDFVDVAFEEPVGESCWFDLVEVMDALGAAPANRFPEPLIPHTLPAKSAALLRVLPQLEMRLTNSRPSFLAEVAQARRKGVGETSAYFASMQNRAKTRASTASNPGSSSLGGDRAKP